MNNSLRSALGLLALGAIGLLTTNHASAGCGYSPPAIDSKMGWSGASARTILQPAVYYAGSNPARFVLTSSDWGPGEEWNRIVGMWRFQLTGPGNSLVDDGYAQWHSDGTELQNSGVHAPMSGNFCMGVWEYVGHSTYKLNHFPLAWQADGQASAVAIQITETVTLTDKDHMTGTFTLSAYPWDSTNGLNVLGPAVQTVSGTVSAERVTIKSTVPGA